MSLAPASEAAPQRRLSQWILILGVFAVLTIVLVVWYYLALKPNYTLLYSELRPQEAAAIVAHLDSEGIAYQVSEGGAQISVASQEADSIRLKLVNAGIGAGATDGFELFDSSDMGLTDFAQKIRYQRALQGELVRTIMLMEGVVEARVHILVPERGLFRGDRAPAEAAVTLVTRIPGAETAKQIEGVQHLVAASVADLAVADVVVLNARGEVISAPAPDAQSQIRSQSLTGRRHTQLERTILSVGRLFPGLRFEVSIGLAQRTELAGDTGQITTQADAHAAQTPTPPSRIIHISTEEALVSAEQEDIRSALQADGLIDAGDQVEFHANLAPAPAENDPAPTIEAPTIEAPAQAAALQGATPEAGLYGRSWSFWAAVMCGLTSACLLAFYVLKRRSPLSLTERESFAAELKQALQLQDQGTRNG